MKDNPPVYRVAWVPNPRKHPAWAGGWSRRNVIDEGGIIPNSLNRYTYMEAHDLAAKETYESACLGGYIAFFDPQDGDDPVI